MKIPWISLILPDGNVWLALAYARHSSHTAARVWLDSQHNSQLFFCRITQLSLLRHLTTMKIMQQDVLTQAGAWDIYRTILTDPRVGFLHEPELDHLFQSLSTRKQISPKLWTDDYLAAFAAAANLTLVTFDRALAARVPSATLLTL